MLRKHMRGVTIIGFAGIFVILAILCSVTMPSMLSGDLSSTGTVHVDKDIINLVSNSYQATKDFEVFETGLSFTVSGKQGSPTITVSQQGQSNQLTIDCSAKKEVCAYKVESRKNRTEKIPPRMRRPVHPRGDQL